MEPTACITLPRNYLQERLPNNNINNKKNKNSNNKNKKNKNNNNKKKKNLQ